MVYTEELLNNNINGAYGLIINELINLERKIPKTKLYRAFFMLLVAGVGYLLNHTFWTIWVLVPSLFLVVFIFGYFKQCSALERLNNLRFDPVFWQRFDQRHIQILPHSALRIGISERQLIEQGFKDYVGLHILQRGNYAMPSQAVDALWHVMLEFPAQYAAFCQQSVGRYINHRSYDSSSDSNADLSNNQQLKQWCGTWRFSCMLADQKPRETNVLPRLFAIDTALNWPNAQAYTVAQLQRLYVQNLTTLSASNSSDSDNDGGDSGSSCSSCGGD